MDIQYSIKTRYELLQLNSMLKQQKRKRLLQVLSDIVVLLPVITTLTSVMWLHISGSSSVYNDLIITKADPSQTLLLWDISRMHTRPDLAACHTQGVGKMVKISYCDIWRPLQHIHFISLYFVLLKFNKTVEPYYKIFWDIHIITVFNKGKGNDW